MMVEIKITRMCGTDFGIFQPGDIARVPAALATDLVEIHRSAEYVTREAAPAKADAPVEQPAKRRKVTK